MPETVAIIGASEKKDRFAYKAMLALQYCCDVKLVNPFKEAIEGRKCNKAIK